MSRRSKVFQKQMYPDIDRGWAWVVLVAAYLGVTLVSTTLYMSGVLYIALLDRYHEGETKTSPVGAVSVGVLCFSGYLYSVMGSYEYSFVVAGGVLFLGSLFGTGSVCSTRKQTTTEAFMETVIIADENQSVFDMTINDSNEINVDKEVQKPLLYGASKPTDSDIKPDDLDEP